MTEKFKVGVWKGLIVECVVPPLIGVVGEGVLIHDCLEQHAVLHLLLGHFAAVGVRYGAEAVETCTHI